MSIGTNLRRLRMAHGLTQQELAAPAYTHAYVSTIEAGRRHPSQAALEHFAAKLDTTVDELVTGVPPDLEPRLDLELSKARRDLSAGHFDEALDHFERLARRARRHGLRIAEAKATAGAATCLERKGQAEAAIERYESALQLLDEEPITSKVDAFSGMARCFSMLGDYRYAAYLLEGTLHGLRDLPDPSALLRIRASLVPLYYDMGLYEKAGREAEEALDLSRSVSDPFRLATMYLNVAQVHLHASRFAQAQDCLEKSEELFSDLELQSEVAMAHLALGYVFLRNKKWRKARDELETARSHFEATNDRMNRARVLNELARLHRLQGRNGEARATAELVLSLVGDDDVRARAIAHRELGITVGDEDPVLAQKNLRAAIDLFEAGDQSSEVAATCRLLGDVLRDQGATEEGCDTYRRGLIALETLV